MKYTRLLSAFLIFYCLLYSNNLNAQWTKLDLLPIEGAHSFWKRGNILAAVTKDDIFFCYTNFDSLFWNKYQADETISGIYENCIFLKTSNYRDGVMFVLAKDTVNNQFALLTTDIENIQTSIEYISEPGEVLNDISYVEYNVGTKLVQLKFAGSNGLVIFYDPYTKEKQKFYDPKGRNFTSIYGDIVTDDTAIYQLHTKPFWVEYKASSKQKTKRMIQNSSHSYLIGEEMIDYSGDLTTTLTTEQDFGKLNGSDALYVNNVLYVAGENGLFVGSPYYWEIKFLQNAINYKDERIVKLDYTTGDYYTGDFLWGLNEKGYVMKTQINTIFLKPYAVINPEVYCNGEYSRFNMKFDLGSARRWFLDDKEISTYYGELNVKLDSGQHEVKVIMKNKDDLSDTAKIIVHSVDKPNNRIVVQVMDSIVCKDHGTEVRLLNTDSMFVYKLRSQCVNDVLGSVEGTGGIANLKSGSLLATTSKKYYLNIQSKHSQCIVGTDSVFGIRVERTKARFHFDEINPNLNDPVHYFQTSQEASSYFWKFEDGASLSTAQVRNPIISYSKAGPTKNTLVAISPDGCKDSLTKSGPYILDEKSLPDEDCWTSNMYNIDPIYDSGDDPSYFQDMQLIEGEDMVVCGHYNDHQFKSKHGQGVDLLNNSGGYIARYSKNGILKWIFNSTLETYHKSFGYYSMFNSVFVDSFENIYATHVAGPPVHSYQFANGDSIKGPFDLDYFRRANFVFKLDKNGRLLDQYRLYSGHPEQIHVDKKGNILISGYLGYKFTYVFGKDTISILNNLSFKDEAYKFILKLDKSGKLLWINYSTYYSGYAQFDKKIGSDKEGNIYVAGMYHGIRKFFSADTTIKPKVLSYPNDNYGPRMHITKYSPEGNIVWNVTCNDESKGTTYVEDLVVKEDGTIYFTGHNFLRNDSMMIYQGDGMPFYTKLGSYFLAKMDANGKVMWVTGESKPYSGEGKAIDVKDNKIAVITNFSNTYLQSDSITHLLSTDGYSYPVEASKFSSKVLFYDTSGVLNGITPIKMPMYLSWNSIFKTKWLDTETLYYGIEGYGNHNSINIDTTVTPFCDPITLANNDGFWGKMKPLQEIVTAVNEDKNEKYTHGLSVYPNPNTGTFTINIPNGETPTNTVEFYTLEGENISSEVNIKNDLNFRFSNTLPNGIYCLKIRTNKAVYQKKLVLIKE